MTDREIWVPTWKESKRWRQREIDGGRCWTNSSSDNNCHCGRESGEKDGKCFRAKHKSMNTAARYNNVTQPIFFSVTVGLNYKRKCLFFKKKKLLERFFITLCDDTSSGSCVINYLWGWKSFLKSLSVITKATYLTGLLRAEVLKRKKKKKGFRIPAAILKTFWRLYLLYIISVCHHVPFYRFIIIMYMLALCKCMFIIIATIQNNDRYSPEYSPE